MANQEKKKDSGYSFITQMIIIIFVVIFAFSILVAVCTWSYKSSHGWGESDPEPEKITENYNDEFVYPEDLKEIRIPIHTISISGNNSKEAMVRAVDFNLNVYYQRYDKCSNISAHGADSITIRKDWSYQINLGEKTKTEMEDYLLSKENIISDNEKWYDVSSE